MTRTAFATLGLALAGIGLYLATVATAHGHAGYDHSVPNNGEVVTVAPSRVDMYTSQDMQNTPGANTLNVIGPNGNDVDNNDSALDPSDLQHMSITLQPGLTSGVYTVEWTTLSFEDGDADDGTFSFTVDLGDEPEPTEPAATDEPDGDSEPEPTVPVVVPSTGGGPGAPGGALALLPALLLAAMGGASLLAGAALWVGARR
jgi:methionine-rich copper-binding protein CopC